MAKKSTIDTKFEQEGISHLDCGGMIDLAFLYIDTTKVAEEIRKAGYEMGNNFKYKLTVLPI